MTSAGVLVLAGVAVAAAFDVRTRRVPNVLTVSMAAGALAAAGVGLGETSIAGALGGLAVGAAVMLPGYAAGATGGGDVKLFAAVGAWLGPVVTAEAFVFAALAGGGLAAAAAWRRGRLLTTLARLTRPRPEGEDTSRRADRDDPGAWIPYAPAIAVGTVLALVM